MRKNYTVIDGFKYSGERSDPIACIFVIGGLIAAFIFIIISIPNV